MQYLHIEKKIVHKDIKPLNLLIDKDENIKICDFSSSGIMPILSKIVTSIRLTNKKNTIGSTPLFRAPEQNITFKSDIWSLGVTLYNLAQLKFPFDGEVEDDIKKNIMNKVPEELDNSYSPELNKLIMKMLTKDPLKRPSAYDFMFMIPKEIKEKYEKHNNTNFEDFFIQVFNSLIGKGDMPKEIKEKFNDLYLIVSDFPNFLERSFFCIKCNKIPKININYIRLEVSSQCECGFYSIFNIKDFYQIFSEQRNQLKADVCTNCSRENEFHKKIYYKFCNDCKKVLCTKCEKDHDKTHYLLKSLKDYNIMCKNHKKSFNYFCQDCFTNLCEECVSQHDSINRGHDIKENHIIDDSTIKLARENVENITKTIIKCEKYIKEKRTDNKFILLLKLNFVKLFLLYKITFLNMYEMNPKNYNAITNFVDNNLEIQDIKIDEDKNKGIIYNIFTPLYNKSITGFDNLIKEKNILNDKNGIQSNNELIDLIEISYNQYLAFSKYGVKKIEDIDLLDCNEVTKLKIDNVYKLKDGRFLISQSNKLKIYNYKENDMILEFEFPIFCKNKITSFLELTNGKLIILSEGIITVFKKNMRKYIIYKNNFHLLEKIFSMVEFDENTFITISEIKNMEGCEKYCCHIKIWNSETFSVIFNSPKHFLIAKHHYNMLKIDNDMVVIILEQKNIFFFKVKDKVALVDDNHNKYSRIIKISDGCFVGISKIEDIPCIIQYEIIGRDNFLKCSKIGFKEIDFKEDKYNEIQNIIISEGRLIAYNKNGKVIIFK